VIAGLAGRLTRSRAARPVLLAAGAASVLLVAAPSEAGLAPAAARAGLAVAALGTAAALARRAPSGATAAAPLAVIARASLGRETGVALLEVEGRSLLVGFGPGGVRLLPRPQPVNEPEPVISVGPGSFTLAPAGATPFAARLGGEP
jgi:flagellar protein FliO/FliZ